MLFFIIFNFFLIFRRKTEVTIPIDHFELYHIHVNTRIVINLREFRSILHFADACGMAVTLHFDRPGRPMIVVVEDNLDFNAEFTLGTLSEDEPIGNHTRVKSLFYYFVNNVSFIYCSYFS